MATHIILSDSIVKFTGICIWKLFIHVFTYLLFIYLCFILCISVQKCLTLRKLRKLQRYGLTHSVCGHRCFGRIFCLHFVTDEQANQKAEPSLLFDPKDGISICAWNTNKLLPDYTECNSERKHIITVRNSNLPELHVISKKVFTKESLSETSG
jgi:hypothetical protein